MTTRSTAPYPLTYERDDFAAGRRPAGRAAPGRRPSPGAGRAAPRPAAASRRATGGPGRARHGRPTVATGMRADDDAGDGSRRARAARAGAAAPAAAGRARISACRERTRRTGPPARDQARRRGGRRWLIPAGVAVAGAAVGAAAVLLTGGHPGAQGGQGAGGAGRTARDAGRRAEQRRAGTAPAHGAPRRRRAAHDGPGQGRARRLHDGEQRRERAAQRHAARLGRVRVQLRDRRGPVPGAAGGGHGALPGVRPGPGDVLHPARRAGRRAAVVRRPGRQRVHRRTRRR